MTTPKRMHLTPRLRTIMEQVPQGAALADIGTDHALIPVALLRRGRISRAIASDVRQGPLDSATRTAREFGLLDAIDLRLGGGLSTVQPHEADTIVIAGMGGELIAQILRDDPWALDGNHLLLLQPVTGLALLRQYLLGQGGVIEKETLCREGRRFYTVLTVRGGGEAVNHPMGECCISEALLQDPLAEEYLRKQLAHTRTIIRALEQASHQKPQELAYQRLCAKTLTQALGQWEENR